ncbi:hypothetical protein DL93DRAFT_381045 [Clavulina sp. PMI_390]|nr:hypothetical protein DL93DRAFT_381045 [Clavulina sp. PMI_390]
MMESSSEKPPIASPGILSDADTSLVAEGSKRDRAVSIEEPRPPKTTSQSAVPSIKPTSTRASSVPNPARPDETPLRHTSSLRSRMSNRDAPAQNSTSRAMTMVSMGLVKKEAPKWKEPTVRQGIRAIIFASRTFSFSVPPDFCSSLQIS